MTPEDILDKKFERATVGGYRAEDVNAFMISIADEFVKMEREQGELQNKLIVLADKLSEYRSDEDSMRSALLNAQKLGDSIIKDSKAKADTMLEAATQEAETVVAAAKRQAEHLSSEARVSLESEAQALSRMQREVVQFKKKILALYQQQMDLIQSIPFDLPQEKLPPLPEPLVSNLAKKVRKAEEAADQADFLEAVIVGEVTAEITEPPLEDPNFEPLQFGDGFRVQNKE